MIEVEDPQGELLVVREVGRFHDARLDAKFCGVRGYSTDRFPEERFNPVIADGTLSLQDHLVQVRLGSESVAAALEPHVPQLPRARPERPR